MPAPRLSPEAISELCRAAITLGLDRAALIAGISSSFISQIEQIGAPGPQIYLDLHEMNLVEVLSDGGDPLRQWLINAATIASPRMEALLFTRHLASLSDGAPVASSGTSTASSPEWMVVDDAASLHWHILNVARTNRLTETTGWWPYRHLACLPDGPYPVVSLAQLADRPWHSRLFQKRGTEMFPPFPISQLGRRTEGSITFGDVTLGSQLSLAIDGSIQYIEYARESSARAHPVWGQDVGLFRCLDRLIGTILFAHRFHQLDASRCVHVALKIGNTGGTSLLVDYGKDRPLAPFRRAFSEQSIVVGGWLRMPSSKEAILQYVTECAQRICFLAGADVSLDSVSSEIRETILDNVNFPFQANIVP